VPLPNGISTALAGCTSAQADTSVAKGGIADITPPKKGYHTEITLTFRLPVPVLVTVLLRPVIRNRPSREHSVYVTTAQGQPGARRHTTSIHGSSLNISTRRISSGARRQQLSTANWHVNAHQLCRIFTTGLRRWQFTMQPAETQSAKLCYVCYSFVFLGI